MKLKTSELRAAVLYALGRMDMETLRRYQAPQLLQAVQNSRYLSDAAAEDLRTSNKLVRASLEAAIENAVREREAAVYRRPRRSRR